jgi:hypothetical protein
MKSIHEDSTEVFAFANVADRKTTHHKPANILTVQQKWAELFPTAGVDMKPSLWQSHSTSCSILNTHKLYS